jgi:hypothetical protein
MELLVRVCGSPDSNFHEVVFPFPWDSPETGKSGWRGLR